jgi:ketopantoate reductase
MSAAHVAIVGAGALGRVYGVRLVSRSESAVTLVVRKDRVDDLGPLRIVHIDGDGVKDAWEKPVLSTTVPDDADVVVVAVRADQLDRSLSSLLEKPQDVPVVLMTPMMPVDYARLRGRHGQRVFAGMAGVAAYIDDDGACRYWLPRLAPTLIDEPRPPVPALLGLVDALSKAGFIARLEPGVQDTNAATTVTFTPVAMAIDAAGSIDALLSDRALSDLALAAVREAMELSSRIGEAAPWVGALASFARPTVLRIGAAIGKDRFPEAFDYVERHFGRKLHGQNVATGGAIVELAKTHDTPHEALDGLLQRLEERARAAKVD